MCARFSLTASGEELAEAFTLEAPPDWIPRYNIAPSQPVLAVRLAGSRRNGERLRWGLAGGTRDAADEGNAPPLPGFEPRSRRPSPLIINARSETAATRPAFREAFASRRCLIPADGFFEWKRLDALRQPYRICRQDGRAFAFAGLWEPSPASDPQEGAGCAILTTEPNPLVRGIHDRMPVILSPSDFGLWLAPDAPRAALEELLRPCPEDLLAAFPVSPRVNRTENDDSSCLEPFAAPGPAQRRLFDDLP